MKYQIYAKNLEITPVLSSYLDKKLVKLDKFSGNVLKLEIELSRDSRHQTGPVFRAEFNLSIPKKLVRVVENDFSINSAIDKAIEQLARQLDKIKDKNLNRKKSDKYNVNFK
ncbi:MAG: ribosome-associated translation inhibitor RaiA [Candidatus Komeilibacteria bacterium]|nr:ribosome-associated translation inhibitor RaiA [Candidatus Komeilibacteria bacterium]